MVDILRVLLLWANGSKILLIICLVLYLTVSLGVIFFRPIFHLSSQNGISQMIVSLTLSLSIVSIVKLSASPHESVTLLELTVFILFTCLMFLAVQKWLHHTISKLYFRSFSGQKPQLHENQNSYDMMDFVLLQFLYENFSQFEDKVKLVMLDHAVRCR
jgi:hypothetical protein